MREDDPIGQRGLLMVLRKRQHSSVWPDRQHSQENYFDLLFCGLRRSSRKHLPSWRKAANADEFALRIDAEEDSLIKLDIISAVVNKTGISKSKAERAVDTVLESMKRALARGERIELRGFGIFNVRPRKAGIGRNPRTGAEVAIAPRKAVRFKPGKELQVLE